jgi:hypothetical protein
MIIIKKMKKRGSTTDNPELLDKSRLADSDEDGLFSLG